MNRSYLNVGVDIAALVLFVFLVSTGLLLVFELPPGSGHASIWGLDRHQWGDVHFWIAMTMLGIITVHLSLHWKWILAKLKPLGHGKYSRRRVIVSVVALVVLLAVALAPHFTQVTEAQRGHQFRGGRVEATSLPVTQLAEQ